MNYPIHRRTDQMILWLLFIIGDYLNKKKIPIKNVNLYKKQMVHKQLAFLLRRQNK